MIGIGNVRLKGETRRTPQGGNTVVNSGLSNKATMGQLKKVMAFINGSSVDVADFKNIKSTKDGIVAKFIIAWSGQTGLIRSKQDHVSMVRRAYNGAVESFRTDSNSHTAKIIGEIYSKLAARLPKV